MATLQNIRDKVRQLTGRKSTVQLTDTDLDFQINNYYQTEFPQQLRLLDLRRTYTFVCTPNVAVYTFPPDLIQSIEPPCYVAGYTVYFTMDQPQFNALWPQLQVNEQDATGDGTAGPYTFTTGQQPIRQGTLMIAAATSFNTDAYLTDDGQGNLIQSDGVTAGGTVNYETGAISISAAGFGTTIPDGNPIQVQYVRYLASRPNMVYYYSNQIWLYPVPDQAYEVSLTAYMIPTALMDASAIPQFAVAGQEGGPPQLAVGGGPVPTTPTTDISEWWEALAYGAAIKIYENNMDLDGMQAMEGLLERKLNLIRRRTWYQLSSQRTKTIYATPTVEAYPGWMYPGLFPGN